MASVVIPTKDEEKVFRAIERAKMNDPDEIIVVNDSESEEDYSKRLEEIEGIRYFECDGGTAAARNLGGKKAETDKILFLDSDCYPTEGWHDRMEEALEDYDLVEGRVDYVGERCPFSRIVENRGEEGKFLTANLGVTRKVFEEVKFDENYPLFREDTDFGLRVLQEGYESCFCDATVEHDTDDMELRDFIGDQKRYVTEPYFLKKFRDSDNIDNYIDRASIILYPKEAATNVLILAFGIISVFRPILGLPLLLGLLMALSAGFSILKMKNKDAKFCFRDWLKGIYYLPIGLMVKRISIWKGAYKNKVLVI